PRRPDDQPQQRQDQERQADRRRYEQRDRYPTGTRAGPGRGGRSRPPRPHASYGFITGHGSYGAWKPAWLSTALPLSDGTQATNACAAGLFAAFFNTTIGYSLIACADSGNSRPSTSDESAFASVR